MVRNYKLIDGCCVLLGTQRLDLHNDFHFNGFEFDASMNLLRTNWLAPALNNQGMEIVFKSVSFLRVVNSGGTDGSGYIDFIGFLAPDDLKTMDGFLMEDEAQPEYHMILSFENSFKIRLYSKRSECRLLD